MDTWQSYSQDQNVFTVRGETFIIEENVSLEKVLGILETFYFPEESLWSIEQWISGKWETICTSKEVWSLQ